MTTDTLKEYPHIEQEIRLKVRMENVNRRYWRTHWATVTAKANEYIGKKVKLSSGDTSKPFKDAMNALLLDDARDNEELTRAWLCVTDYSVYVKISSRHNGARGESWVYHETTHYILNVKDGIGEAMEHVAPMQDDLNADEMVKLYAEADALKQQYDEARDKIWYGARPYLK